MVGIVFLGQEKFLKVGRYVIEILFMNNLKKTSIDRMVRHCWGITTEMLVAKLACLSSDFITFWDTDLEHVCMQMKNSDITY